MNTNRQFSTIKQRFDHLVKVLSSDRFLKIQGLNNEVPFFICPYAPEEAVEMTEMQDSLITRLQRDGINALNINLYDLVIEILKDNDDWDWYLENEKTISKAQLKEDLQGILQIERGSVTNSPREWFLINDVINETLRCVNSVTASRGYPGLVERRP